MFLNQIKYEANDFYKKINRIITSKKTVGIYGNGIYASFLKERLQKWSIQIAYYVVDDDYYVEGKKDLIKLSELHKYEDSILIIGFETIVENEEFLNKKIAGALLNAPGIEIIDFEHCYIDWDFITYDYILNHYKEYQKVYDMFEDDLSRRIMIEYLNTCISGKSKDFCLLKTDHDHDYEYSLLYRDSVMNGTIIECGAYDGKTVVELDEFTSEYDNKILALEPDDINYVRLCKNIENRKRIIPIKKGVSDKDGKLYFLSQGNQGGTLIESKDVTEENSYTTIDVTSVDSLAKEYGCIDSVLMDVEGSELSVLTGAIETINLYRPRFAVRVYHKREDLYTIPLFFDNLNIDNKYKLYLRNNANSRGILDLTLYAL